MGVRPQSPDESRSASSEFWAGALSGLLPLLVAATLTAATVGVTLLARYLTSGESFATQQQAALLCVAIGLALTLVVFVTLAIFAVRRVGRWQRAERPLAAAASLATLALTALLMLTPLLLAIFLPQHPAQ